LILVFGTICLDRLRRVPRLPTAGGYVEIEQESAMLGGEAANTANALRHWGHEVLLAGNALGSGHDARKLHRLLEASQIPTDWIAPVGQPADQKAPVCDVYVTPDGDRTMFGRGFAQMGPGVPLEYLPYREDEWFTAEPNMGAPAREAVRRALDAGMKTYLMDFYHPEDSIVPGSFWQCSTDWQGTRGNQQKNVRWVQDWVARYGCFATLSDGPNGFVFGGPDWPARAYPPFPAPLMVDSTGAGDMFRAGMLHGLSQNWPVADCLRYASAAGSLKCAHFGATAHVPPEAEIQAFICQNPSVASAY